MSLLLRIETHIVIPLCILLAFFLSVFPSYYVSRHVCNFHFLLYSLYMGIQNNKVVIFRNLLDLPVQFFFDVRSLRFGLKCETLSMG